MSTKYRPSFKEESKSICSQVRQELGLTMTQRLDPWLLARHLDITVVPLGYIERFAPYGCHHFLHENQSAFSAVTVFRGAERIIVHNDAHTVGRQASDITHEIAHGLLMHTPLPALDGRGCRYWDPVIEREAEWLAGVLLVPEQAVLLIVRRGWFVGTAANYFSVSERLIEWRLNVTGAYVRVERETRKYASIH